MNTVVPVRPTPAGDEHERQARIDLAAAFRLAARFGWHEAVANHFSLCLPGSTTRFLINPRWKHFSRIAASDLMVCDADDAETMNRPDAPDPSAWCIHGSIHRLHPAARCLLHVHSPYATAVAALADPTIRPIDQNTARFFNRISIDSDYGGIADDEAEGRRLAGRLGNRRIMMMGNHGVLVAADTVAQAFDDLYYLERACQTLVLAYSTGQPLNVMSDQLAERTARDWEDYAGSAEAHFAEMKAVLDDEEPDYAA